MAHASESLCLTDLCPSFIFTSWLISHTVSLSKNGNMKGKATVPFVHHLSSGL